MATDIQSTGDPSIFNRLRWYNAVMGIFHLVQSVIIFVISSDFTLPVNTSFLNFIPETQRLQPATETIINLPLGAMVALFLLISAIAHFIIASPLAFNWYVHNLKRGINYARWYEYSISASIMIVLIAMLCGFMMWLPLCWPSCLPP
jgi:hypothetical protein